MLTIIIFILTLLFLVLFHELGHFGVARYFGIAIEAFSIGFGPAIWKIQSKKHHTQFRFGPILLGGYVKFAEHQTDHPHEELYEHAASWKKILILLAGPGFNLLLAWICLVFFFKIDFYALKPYIGMVKHHSVAEQLGFKARQLILSVNDEPVASWNQVIDKLKMGTGDGVLDTRDYQTYEKSQHRIPVQYLKDQFEFFDKLGFEPYMPAIPVIIGRISPHSAAEKGGLQIGDRITHINHISVKSMQELVLQLNKLENPEIELSIIRDAVRYQKKIQVEYVQQQHKKVARLGIASQQLESFPKWFVKQHYGWFDSIQKGSETFAFLIKTQLLGWMHFRDNSTHISGPIGMARAADEAWQMSPRAYLMYIVWLNLGLAILNLLPLPILDGGQCLMVIWQTIFPRSLNPKRQKFLILLSVMIMMSLFFLGLINDWTL